MAESVPCLLLRPEMASPLDGWSWYGAHQLLEIAGVPFEEGASVSEKEQAELVIVPNSASPKALAREARRALEAGKVVVVGCEVALALLQEGTGIGALPQALPPLPPTAPESLLSLQAYALLPAAFTETTLPLLGEPVLFATHPRALGSLRTVGGQQGPLAWTHPVGEGVLVVLAGRIFETCGLLLSRYSWFAHPHRRDSFLHRVDPLWDRQLTPWHRFPVVSFYARFLTWLLSAVLWERGNLLPLRWCLPHEDDQPFRMAVTGLHDVEMVFSDPVAKRADNPYNRFADWLEMEQRLGVRSAFFFLSPVTALPPHWRPNYEVTDEAILAAFDLIEERGSEIGLLSIAHASESALAMEREQLEDFGGVFVWGVRNYRFSNTPASVRHKSVVGFAYDASWVAAQEQPSFLTGCVQPFRPLDSERWQVLPIVELSAVLDDRVLLGENRYDGDASRMGISFCETVFALNGVLGLSWQQHTFEQNAPVYEQLVRHCQQIAQNAVWCPAPREVAEWWVGRNEVRLFARPVRPRWWMVEAVLTEDFEEALAFVLALPAPKEVRVLKEGTSLPVHLLTSLGSLRLWGVPLVLEPGEPIRLSVGVTI